MGILVDQFFEATCMWSQRTEDEGEFVSWLVMGRLLEQQNLASVMTDLLGFGRSSDDQIRPSNARMKQCLERAVRAGVAGEYELVADMIDTVTDKLETASEDYAKGIARLREFNKAYSDVEVYGPIPEFLKPNPSLEAMRQNRQKLVVWQELTGHLLQQAGSSDGRIEGK